MDIEVIKETLAKIPLIPVLLAVAGYLAWDYHDFTSSDDSALVQQHLQIQTIKDENAKLEVQLKQVQEFARNLEAKKVDLRNLALELDALKTSISETLDLPDFMKSTITEAKRVGLNVTSLRPTTLHTDEFYAEQSFDLKFRGAFVQLVVFLDRLANMQKLVRVDDMEIKPLGSATARHVELEGTIQIKAYRYRGSQADELFKKDAAAAGAEGST